MLYQVTAGFIAVSAVLIILYDIWVVWKKGGRGTISWTLCVWWLLHPGFMVGIFGLCGHLFWPLCAGVEGQPVNRVWGSLIGLLFSVAILWEVFHRWAHDAAPTPTVWHVRRLLIWAMLGFWAGHQLFGQQIACLP